MTFIVADPSNVRQGAEQSAGDESVRVEFRHLDCRVVVTIDAGDASIAGDHVAIHAVVDPSSLLGVGESLP